LSLDNQHNSVLNLVQIDIQLYAPTSLRVIGNLHQTPPVQHGFCQ
jgi:hypothetical protein